MQLLITGGTGFIGSRLALRCVREGFAVRAVGRRNNPAEAATAEALVRAGVDFRDVSVADAEALAAAMAGVDVVFHLAAAQHEANVPDSHFEAVNVTGTRNALAAAERAGVKRFVHGSTIGVFGGAARRLIHDDSPLEPENIYGSTKLAAERVVAEFGSRLPAVVVRISETYGPGDRRLLKLFKAASKGMLVQVGAGKNLHHPIYIDDLLDGLLAAAKLDSAVGATFVLAGPTPVTSREMLKAVAAASGGARIVRIPMLPLLALAWLLETALRPFGVQPPLHRRRMDFFRKSFHFSGLEARKRIGFEPRVDLESGMHATAQWYRDEGLLAAPAAHHTKPGRFAPLDVAAAASMRLAAEIEPFDSFWEGPSNIEKGYRTVYEFYRHNYLAKFPADRSAPILVVSCGPGYMVDMLVRHGYQSVTGIDSDAEKVEPGRRRGLDCRAERAFPWVAARESHYQA
ncbi:MAG TPA: NAD-dependent epimerase/dehydratase family protein, partial [Myxococcota bacterium]|nr:NAD-dependent epimerase/dehydratase family protein [Myxococcota bacterium]